MSKSRVIMVKKIQKLDKRSDRRTGNQALQEQIKVYQGPGKIKGIKEGEEED